jgi:peptidoglycan/LPS O-acetylase OafA/YrhL
MQPLFGADMISSHATWIDLGLLKHPISCLAEQLPYFFVYNVVAPDIVPNPGNPWDKYGLAGSIPTTWILAVALYVPLVLGAAYALWKTQRFKSRLFVTLALFLGFSIVLHLFYGASEPHLYAAHYTFAWVAMLACAFSADGAARRLPAGVSALLVAVLTATCALVAVNNLSFLYRIYVAHP